MKCNECNRAQSNLRHNQILIRLCILSFFSVLNEMVLNVSLPDIANDFNKPPASEYKLGEHSLYVNLFHWNSCIWKAI